MMRTTNLLTVRQQCCVTIAALYAVNSRNEAGRQLEAYLAASSLPTIFLEELFFHLSLVLGFPAMLDGLEAVRTIRPSATSLRRNTHAGNSGIGMKVLSRIYGGQTEKLLRNIGALHKDARTMIVYDVYGKIFSRRGVTLKERELINMSVLAIQGFERQLYSHLRGCMRVGITADALRAALTIVQKVSKRRMTRAKEILRSVVSQGKKL